MKKLLLLLTSLALTLPGAAQKTNFEGIEIDGTPDEFCALLEAEGFERLEEEDDALMLAGEALGQDECVVLVHSEANLVYALTVGVMECESWDELEDTYFDLRDALEGEYGAPADAAEYFDNLDADASDAAKFAALLSRQGELSAWFSSDDGYVRLSVEIPDGYTPESCFITLYYCNENNAEFEEDGEE